MSHDFLYYVSKKIEKIFLFAKCIYFLKSYLILKFYKILIIRSRDIRGTYYRGTALYEINTKGLCVRIFTIEIVQ